MLQRLIVPRHQLAPPQPFAHVRKRGEQGAVEYDCRSGATHATKGHRRQAPRRHRGAALP